MNEQLSYIERNKDLWNTKTEWHLKSGFYDMAGFLKGKNTLNEPELKLLGDIKGLSVLHLQCHFGQDTISLNRMGAIVTGVDLSDKAVAAAKDIALQTGSDATFICSDIYDLRRHLDKKFDIVFTSYGTIGWLPDLDQWAGVIEYFLKPGGRFVFAEFHPAVWMFDNDFTKVAYSYFKSGPIVETETGTYAEREAPIETTSVTWNHGLAEVIGSLLGSGLLLFGFEEYDYSPYNCFRNTIEFEPGKFHIRSMEGKLPMMYTLSAGKV